MSVLVTNIGINPTTVEPNFSAWTENQNTIGALRPDRNFATWVHLPRLGSAPLIGFLANIHRKIGRKTLIWQICCEQEGSSVPTEDRQEKGVKRVSFVSSGWTDGCPHSASRV